MTHLSVFNTLCLLIATTPAWHILLINMFTGKHVTTSHTNLYRKQTAWKPHVNRNRVHKISSNILLLVFLFLRSSVHKYWRHMRWRLSSQHPRMIKQLKVISRETTSIRLCTQRDRIYTHPKPLSNLSPIIVIRREEWRRRTAGMTT